MYVAILLNEDAISLPIILAIELVEALSEPEANDVAIEIYRNQEKDGWIDLKFKRFFDKKEIRRPTDENYIVTATRENFEEVIARSCSWL